MGSVLEDKMKMRVLVILAFIFLINLSFVSSSSFGYNSANGINLSFVSSSSFGYNSANGINIGGASNNTYYNNYSYYNTTGNATQFTTSGNTLTLLESWFVTLWNAIFGTKTTDDLTQGTTNLYDNQSFNQSLTDSLYVGGSGDNATWNESLASSIFAKNTTADIQGLLNFTGIYNTGSGDNASWNESLASTKFYGITNPNNYINSSANNSYVLIGSGNQTLVDCSNITGATSNLCTITSGASGAVTGINTTQMENSTVINIKESWISTIIHFFLDNIFTAISQNVSSINTTANIQNLLNSTGIYSGGGLTSQQINDSIILISVNSGFNNTANSTYDAFRTNVSKNYTVDAIDNIVTTYNTTWSSTFNATYDASISNNTFNQSVTDNLYITKANESKLNVNSSKLSNSSTWWANSNSTNSTQFENVNGLLHLVESWFESKWNSLFRNWNNQDLNTTSNVSFNNVSSSGVLSVPQICLDGDCRSTWPTGTGGSGIIASGSNANGYYVQFADGTMMQWGYISRNDAMDTVMLGGYRSGGTNSNLPIPFIDSAYSITGSSIGTNAISFVVNNLSSTQMQSFFTGVTVQGAAVRTANWFAVGRWTTLTNITQNTTSWAVNSNGDTILFDSTKKVGIGTSSPSEKLTVIGNANITGNLTLGIGKIMYNSTTGSYYYNNGTSWYAFGTGASSGTGLSNYSNFSNYSYYWGNSINSTNSTQIGVSNGVLSVLESWFTTFWNSLFRNWNNQNLNTTNSPTFVNLTLTGNVGIGTTNPSSKLEVLGNANITGNLTVRGNLSMGYVTNSSTATGATDISTTCPVNTRVIGGGCSHGSNSNQNALLGSYPSPTNLPTRWNCNSTQISSTTLTAYVICARIG